MFANLSTAFSVVKNLANIKDIASVVYVAVAKLLVTLVFIQGQVTDTKLGKVLEKYLPKSVEVLEKIKALFEKYSKIIGLNLTVAAQSIISEETLLEELERSSSELDAKLK